MDFCRIRTGRRVMKHIAEPSERERNIERQRKLAEKDDLTDSDKAELRALAGYFDREHCIDCDSTLHGTGSYHCPEINKYDRDE